MNVVFSGNRGAGKKFDGLETVKIKKLTIFTTTPKSVSMHTLSLNRSYSTPGRATDA